MYSFEWTQDANAISTIITEPMVYRRAGDDFAPPRELFQPRDDIWWALVQRENGPTMGLFAIVPCSMIVSELHTCLLPHAWGKPAREIFPEFLDWFWPQTACQRLITAVPEFNRAAMKIGREWGFVEWGVNPNAFQKWGRLHNVHMLGLSRPENLCPSSAASEV